jgi:hypothetical protein
MERTREIEERFLPVNNAFGSSASQRILKKHLSWYQSGKYGLRGTHFRSVQLNTRHRFAPRQRVGQRIRWAAQFQQADEQSLRLA